MHHRHTPAPRSTTALAAALLLSLLSVLPSSVVPSALSADMVGTLHSTIIASPTGSVRYVGHNVGRIVWVDCRNITPATATVTVSRIYSEGPGTDTVATVVCTAGLGRSAPTTNIWFTFLGEYYSMSGCLTGTVRVVTSGVP
jgi:hypothetical protein